MKEETQPKRPESARACWPWDHRRAAGDNSACSRPGPHAAIPAASSFCRMGTSDKRNKIPSKAKAQNAVHRIWT